MSPILAGSEFRLPKEDLRQRMSRRQAADGFPMLRAFLIQSMSLRQPCAGWAGQLFQKRQLGCLWLDLFEPERLLLSQRLLQSLTRFDWQTGLAPLAG